MVEKRVVQTVARSAGPMVALWVEWMVEQSAEVTVAKMAEQLAARLAEN